MMLPNIVLLLWQVQGPKAGIRWGNMRIGPPRSNAVVQVQHAKQIDTKGKDLANENTEWYIMFCVIILSRSSDMPKTEMECSNNYSRAVFGTLSFRWKKAEYFRHAKINICTAFFAPRVGMPLTLLCGINWLPRNNGFLRKRTGKKIRAWNLITIVFLKTCWLRILKRKSRSTLARCCS